MMFSRDKYNNLSFQIYQNSNIGIGDTVNIRNHLDWIDAIGVVTGINFDYDGLEIEFSLVFCHGDSQIEGFANKNLSVDTKYSGSIDWDRLTYGKFS